MTTQTVIPCPLLQASIHQGQAPCGHATVRQAVWADCQAPGPTQALVAKDLEKQILTVATIPALKTSVSTPAGVNLCHPVMMVVEPPTMDQHQLLVILFIETLEIWSLVPVPYTPVEE